jgi:hypothetical protein
VGYSEMKISKMLSVCIINNCVFPSLLQIPFVFENSGGWSLFPAGFFLGLLFDLEDGSTMFLRDVGDIQC